MSDPLHAGGKQDFNNELKRLRDKEAREIAENRDLSDNEKKNLLKLIQAKFNKLIKGLW